MIQVQIGLDEALKIIDQCEAEQYGTFVEKFKTKKTTDDCLTPPLVYEAVLGWVKNEYQLGEDVEIVRPFWPGRQYELEEYVPNCVVVDNPPFSILRFFPGARDPLFPVCARADHFQGPARSVLHPDGHRYHI